MEKKKKKILLISSAAAAAVIAGIVIAVIIGLNSKGDTVIKKVIKKIVVVNSEEEITSSGSKTENESDTGYSGTDSANSGTQTDDELSNRKRRALPSTDAEEYVPEYTVTDTAWNGPAGYVIVYADGDKNSYKTAESIREYFKKEYGTDLKTVSDKSSEAAKEIIVGSTKRYTSKLSDNKYSVKLAGNKLIFDGKNFAMTEKAARWFTSLKSVKGRVNLIEGECKDFEWSKKNGYTYVWGDDFDGNIINSAKWSFKEKMSPTGKMIFLTDESVARVNEGKLKLSAIRYYNKMTPTAEYATIPGLCTTNSMSFKYGYLEMRAKVPIKRGAWPSFWMTSNDVVKSGSSKYSYFTEVDIFEAFGSNSTIIPNIHKWYTNVAGHSQYEYDGSDARLKKKEYSFADTSKLTEEYHIYGFKWTPKEMTMSVDGKEYMTFDLTYNFNGKDNMDGFNVPMQIIFNNHMYPSDSLESWSQNQILVDNTTLPFDYFIDWVRLYQQDGEGELNIAD